MCASGRLDCNKPVPASVGNCTDIKISPGTGAESAVRICTLPHRLEHAPDSDSGILENGICGSGCPENLMRSEKAARDFQSAMATALPWLPEIRLHQDFWLSFSFERSGSAFIKFPGFENFHKRQIRKNAP
jgi:hypothetical protein